MWAWKKDLFAGDAPQVHAIVSYSKKFLQIFALPIAFGVISAINGIVIRVALICSNIVLVPIMTCLQIAGFT